MSDSAPDSNLTVSVEQDGRTLSGVGVTADSLRETMDARTAEEAPAAPSAPATDTTSAEPPQLTKGRARYSELTDKVKAEAARADAAEKKAQELEARYAQQPPPARDDRPLGTQSAPAVQDGAARPAAPTRPRPSEDEVGHDLKYKTYGAFVADDNDWVWEQKQADIDRRIQDGISGHQQSQAFGAQVDATRVKGRAAYKDFDAVMNGTGAAATANMPIAAQQFIWQQPNAEHLVYAILRDPVLAQRLTWLSTTQPAAFWLELARLAPAAPAASPASTGNPGSATPPPPMQPVGSGSTTTKLSSAEHARTGNYEAYKAARTAERGGSRRR